MESPRYRAFESFDLESKPTRTGAIDAPLGRISLTGYTPEIIAEMRRVSPDSLVLSDKQQAAIAASNAAIESAVKMHGIGLDGRPVDNRRTN